MVLVHCNNVNNRYQHDSWVLSTFVPNKSFGQLLNISPINHFYTGAFCSEFSYIEVWFIDQTDVLKTTLKEDNPKTNRSNKRSSL